ncbi:hypothetical protein glysoja_048310 [Glycine soja]|uniref:Uncharacterized protein n=1 Tax=Glycine soja TaxID=3848 RepID=A0A0B2QWX4_GLYSO|nr:hypothetical protein glysoja_048310 [Glycine soja]
MNWTRKGDNIERKEEGTKRKRKRNRFVSILSHFESVAATVDQIEFHLNALSGCDLGLSLLPQIRIPCFTCSHVVLVKP